VKVILELEEEDFVRLIDLQHEILAVLERMEKLLQEQTDGNDTRKKS
jgi:hypothetical protein|tara:strand:+ start:1880 stop:2020 length:141 start_codon:yes stop_codon:yes gene_type:complete